MPSENRQRKRSNSEKGLIWTMVAAIVVAGSLGVYFYHKSRTADAAMEARDLQADSLPSESIAAQEAEAQAEAERAEALAMEKVRQDSLARVQKILDAIPTYAEVSRCSGSSFTSLFRSKGFEANERTVYDENGNDGWEMTATLNSGGTPSCHFYVIAADGDRYEMTINGSPQLLEKFYRDCKRDAEAMWGAEASSFYHRSGNTVIWGS